MKIAEVFLYNYKNRLFRLLMKFPTRKKYRQEDGTRHKITIHSCVRKI